ncbi:hypothetical protein DIT71_13550 [Marinobacter vulgaris]|uniref:DUF2135 domain-containing protein n=1 Tax=Marinobacter vulgaris TaxID=1928331 RepID=A0A2V3ZHU5_9GAMM|nr:hypothetical protein [Marinobacter vulgaris]PXX89551.1 hypothetical protein DIT71_13550 [Marinobacter vulgaris]TSJ68541.1 hypothetical protein FPC41_13545 [Marinobacter vulgaris]
MSKPTRTFLSFAISLFIITSTSLNAFAQPYEARNFCRDSGIIFAFFNGVQTTIGEANRALNEFRRIHGNERADGENIRYEVMYNYTDGLDDFVETFEQRVLEQEQILAGRYELALEIINGGGKWWQRLAELATTLPETRDDFINWYQAKIVQSLTSLAGNPPTITNYSEHQSRVDTWIVEGKQILMVAHSQGNLFANSAYGYASDKIDNEALNLVHIAPASPTTNGPHRLADKDLVINALRASGSVVGITDIIPGYLNRPGGLNGQTDILGHGLLEIYLNPALGLGAAVVQNIETELANLQPPETEFEAETGFFTATLTWNGAGDVDLHVYEPSGSHVFYQAMTGTSGYLDVDNTVANGPEHYFAACEAEKLQAGTYQVGIANYDRADGRTASLQIASFRDGVLGTRSVTLGPPTGDNPSHIMFDVEVVEDSETGEFEVIVQ